VRVVRDEKCGLILACSGDIVDLPAGYLASLWSRCPFYAYIFDYYSHQWTQRLHRALAQRVEPIVLKRAAGVIVPNEFLRDEYHRRYQVEPTVIHNPCEVWHTECEFPWPASQGQIRIVYTGAVHHANDDAFRNLIAAIHLLDRVDVELHLYTAQPPAELERAEIRGPVVRHNPLAPSHVSEVHRTADILFLPLAFNSAIPEVIKTSAPGKMGEYLASGRPVLVHAPADSFVSWYFAEHHCGVVVDQSEPAMLAQAITRILADAELRRSLVDSARARARADFDLAGAQTQFVRALQPKVRK
jgi:glycosyltransferase involved in cell wall biosynthesis